MFTRRRIQVQQPQDSSSSDKRKLLPHRRSKSDGLPLGPSINRDRSSTLRRQRSNNSLHNNSNNSFDHRAQSYGSAFFSSLSLGPSNDEEDDDDDSRHSSDSEDSGSSNENGDASDGSMESGEEIIGISPVHSFDDEDDDDEDESESSSFVSKDSRSTLSTVQLRGGFLKLRGTFSNESSLLSKRDDSTLTGSYSGTLTESYARTLSDEESEIIIGTNEGNYQDIFEGIDVEAYDGTIHNRSTSSFSSSRPRQGVKAVHYYHHDLTTTNTTSSQGCQTPAATRVEWPQDSPPYQDTQSSTAMCQGGVPPSPQKTKKYRDIAMDGEGKMIMKLKSAPPTATNNENLYYPEAPSTPSKTNSSSLLCYAPNLNINDNKSEATTVVHNNRTKKGLAGSMKSMVSKLAKKVLATHNPNNRIKQQQQQDAVFSNNKGKHKTKISVGNKSNSQFQLETPPRDNTSTPATWPQSLPSKGDGSLSLPDAALDDSEVESHATASPIRRLFVEDEVDSAAAKLQPIYMTPERQHYLMTVASRDVADAPVEVAPRSGNKTPVGLPRISSYMSTKSTKATTKNARDYNARTVTKTQDSTVDFNTTPPRKSFTTAVDLDDTPSSDETDEDKDVDISIMSTAEGSFAHQQHEVRWKSPGNSDNDLDLEMPESSAKTATPAPFEKQQQSSQHETTEVEKLTLEEMDRLLDVTPPEDGSFVESATPPTSRLDELRDMIDDNATIEMSGYEAVFNLSCDEESGDEGNENNDDNKSNTPTDCEPPPTFSPEKQKIRYRQHNRSKSMPDVVPKSITEQPPGINRVVSEDLDVTLQTENNFELQWPVEVQQVLNMSLATESEGLVEVIEGRRLTPTRPSPPSPEKSVQQDAKTIGTPRKYDFHLPVEVQQLQSASQTDLESSVEVIEGNPSPSRRGPNSPARLVGHSPTAVDLDDTVESSSSQEAYFDGPVDLDDIETVNKNNKSSGSSVFSALDASEVDSMGTFYTDADSVFRQQKREKDLDRALPGRAKYSAPVDDVDLDDRMAWTNSSHVASTKPPLPPRRLAPPIKDSQAHHSSSKSSENNGIVMLKHAIGQEPAVYLKDPIVLAVVDWPEEIDSASLKSSEQPDTSAGKSQSHQTGNQKNAAACPDPVCSPDQPKIRPKPFDRRPQRLIPPAAFKKTRSRLTAVWEEPRARDSTGPVDLDDSLEESFKGNGYSGPVDLDDTIETNDTNDSASGDKHHLEASENTANEKRDPPSDKLKQTAGKKEVISQVSKNKQWFQIAEHEHDESESESSRSGVYFEQSVSTSRQSMQLDAKAAKEESFKSATSESEDWFVSSSSAPSNDTPACSKKGTPKKLSLPPKDTTPVSRQFDQLKKARSHEKPWFDFADADTTISTVPVGAAMEAKSPNCSKDESVELLGESIHHTEGDDCLPKASKAQEVKITIKDDQSQSSETKQIGVSSESLKPYKLDSSASGLSARTLSWQNDPDNCHGVSDIIDEEDNILLDSQGDGLLADDMLHDSSGRPLGGNSDGILSQAKKYKEPQLKKSHSSRFKQKRLPNVEAPTPASPQSSVPKAADDIFGVDMAQWDLSDGFLNVETSGEHSSTENLFQEEFGFPTSATKDKDASPTSTSLDHEIVDQRKEISISKSEEEDAESLALEIQRFKATYLQTQTALDESMSLNQSEESTVTSSVANDIQSAHDRYASVMEELERNLLADAILSKKNLSTSSPSSSNDEESSGAERSADLDELDKSFGDVQKQIQHSLLIAEQAKETLDLSLLRKEIEKLQATKEALIRDAQKRRKNASNSTSSCDEEANQTRNLMDAFASPEIKHQATDTPSDAPTDEKNSISTDSSSNSNDAEAKLNHSGTGDNSTFVPQINLSPAVKEEEKGFVTAMDDISMLSEVNTTSSSIEAVRQQLIDEFLETTTERPEDEDSIGTPRRYNGKKSVTKRVLKAFSKIRSSRRLRSNSNVEVDEDEVDRKRTPPKLTYSNKSEIIVYDFRKYPINCLDSCPGKKPPNSPAKASSSVGGGTALSIGTPQVTPPRMDANDIVHTTDDGLTEI